MPAARGEAKAESKQGYMEVEVEFDNLLSATRFGPEFLTYVMWAITPEGRATSSTQRKTRYVTPRPAAGGTVPRLPRLSYLSSHSGCLTDLGEAGRADICV